MFLFVGTLLFAWIASLIAMKFYDLDKEKMLMIQNELQDRKDEVQAKKERAKENQ